MKRAAVRAFRGVIDPDRVTADLDAQGSAVLGPLLTMRVLLDTHLVLWALARPAKLSAAARKQIESAEVHISAASIWEISIKAALGRLVADAREVLEAIEPTGFSLLPITGEHAAKVAELPPLHRDPFDRMLVRASLLRAHDSTHE